MKLKESTFNRRKFLNGFLGFGFTGLLGYLLYPVKKFLLKGMEYKPPESVSVPKEVVLRSIAEKGYHLFFYGREEAIVFSDPRDKSLKALSAICTHAACTVQYVPKLEHIWCACHNGHYDLDGKVISGPPPRPLTAFEINENLETGEIIFSKRNG